MAGPSNSEYHEREDKYDVDQGFTVPDLGVVLPAGGRIETAELALTSTYYDTATADLRRNRLTLRRREGDADTGWHLKLPATKASRNARIEIHFPDGPELPDELSRLLTGVRRGADLLPVARLVTHRTAYRLLDADGSLLAEVADDRVDATALGAGHPASGGSVGQASDTQASDTRASDTRASDTQGSETEAADAQKPDAQGPDTQGSGGQWREVEVEAGPGASSVPAGTQDDDPAQTVLAEVGAVLVAAGARASDSASKLSRALGVPASPPPVGPDSTLADLVSDYITTQCAVIVAGELGVRLEHDVVHPTRVAIRRLRSTLRTFAPLFDAGAAATFENELVWFAGLLGAVRDADVLRLRLDRLVADLPDELVLGPVAARIDNQLAAERAEHWQELVTALDSARMLALLGLVEQWRLAPPFVDQAEGPVDTVPARRVRKYLARARSKLDKRLVHAARPGPDQETLVHQARKAGKRFRYAAELAEPVLGSRASDQVAEAQTLQDLLGEHQDSVVSVAALRRFGAAAGATPGENGFTFGILLEAELERAAEIRTRIASREVVGTRSNS